MVATDRGPNARPGLGAWHMLHLVGEDTALMKVHAGHCQSRGTDLDPQNSAS